MKITFKPYLGPLEPIKSVTVAEVHLYDKHLELRKSYDWEPYMPEPDDTGYVKYAITIPKHMVTIELTESWHDKDVQKQSWPVVHIIAGNSTSLVHVETEKEAVEIYNKIKHWLINE